MKNGAGMDMVHSGELTVLSKRDSTLVAMPSECNIRNKCVIDRRSLGGLIAAETRPLRGCVSQNSVSAFHRFIRPDLGQKGDIHELGSTR
jgi:hypothetical protein